MSTIEFVTIEVTDVPDADRFYDTAFGVGDRVRARAGEEVAVGLRRRRASPGRDDRDACVLDEEGLRPRRPADRRHRVLQLGVADVGASKRFYSDRGLVVAKSYGRQYVELDTGPVTLTLNKRRALAKAAGVSPDGTGSHRLSIGSDAGPFTDPDGFVWDIASP